MIKLESNKKISGRVGSMIPFLRNCRAKLATLEIKGRRQRSMMISSLS
jgi:hypothetical protein